MILLLTPHSSFLIARYGTGFQPAVVCVTIIRRQMLSHFPTVTQSTGFQPEPLLTTHCSLLIAHSPSLTPHRSLLITHNGLRHNTHLTSSLNPHSLLLRIILFSPSLRLCFPFDDKAKFYRRQSEVLSKTYRTSIEHLSKTYRTPIEDSMCQLFYPPPYGLSVAQKNGHIAKYLLFDK